MSKILIVEDSIDTIDYVSAILEENGFEVMVATRWKQALFIAQNTSPDCILLDIMLPERNGYEICEELHNDPSTSLIPVIFMSALSKTIDKVRAFKTGGVDFLNKPIEHQELLARINTHLTIYNLQKQLIASNDKLEYLVIKRTQELSMANEYLVSSLSELEQRNIQLKESNSRHQHITDSISDYLYKVKIINNRPVQTEHNNHCVDVLGYTAAEFEENDKLWAEIIHPDDRIRVINEIVAFQELEIKRTIEHRIIHKEGRVLWVSNTLVPFFDDNGIFSEYYGVIRDISERKNHQHQLMTAIIETEERERQRFSQELHDGLGPLFSAAKMYVECMQQTNDTAEILEMAKKAEEIISMANTTAREISLNLSPNVLQNYGLVSAVQSFFSYISDNKNMRVNFIHRCGRISFLHETTLYRVITELTNNTIKHANAKNIFLRIENSHGKLAVEYRDDGVGFDVNKIKNGYGLGVNNIINRIESIGGTVVVSSQNNEGIVVRLELTEKTT